MTIAMAMEMSLVMAMAMAMGRPVEGHPTREYGDLSSNADSKMIYTESVP